MQVSINKLFFIPVGWLFLRSTHDVKNISTIRDYVFNQHYKKQENENKINPL